MRRSVMAVALGFALVPMTAAAHFHKTECFCFNQQILEGEQAVDMPLRFVVDQDLPRDIRHYPVLYPVRCHRPGSGQLAQSFERITES